MGRPPRGPVKVDKLGRPLNFGNYVNGRLVVTGSKKKGGGKGKGGSKGGRGGRGGSSGGGRGVGGGGRGGGSSGSSGGSGGPRTGGSAGARRRRALSAMQLFVSPRNSFWPVDELTARYVSLSGRRARSVISCIDSQKSFDGFVVPRVHPRRPRSSL